MRKALATAALIALTLAATGLAGPPGRWTPISKGHVESTDEAGLARTPDGVLHAVWQRRGAVASALWQTRISPLGATMELGPVAGSLSNPGSPGLTAGSDGTLRAFFFASTADGTSAALRLANASASGLWTVVPEPLAQVSDPTSPAVGVATTREGTPVVAWSAGRQIRYRYGVDPAAPLAALGAGGCCAAGVQPAVDQATGQAYVAWASSASGGMGVYVQAVDRSGPTRPRVFATGSATKKRTQALLPEGRVALASRSGAPGVYLAYAVGYPRVRAISVLHVGVRKLVLEVKAPDAAHVLVAAAPQGRLWLVWSRDGVVFATRTNRSVTRVGAVQKIPARRGARAIDELQGDAALGPIDLVASFETRATASFWHQRVLPGLSLAIQAAPSTVGSKRYVFRVTDAGESVGNATVRVGKQSLTTGLSGLVALETSDRPPTATASKSGYATATTRLP